MNENGEADRCALAAKRTFLFAFFFFFAVLLLLSLSLRD
jgi:hypothetical protein